MKKFLSGIFLILFLFSIQFVDLDSLTDKPLVVKPIKDVGDMEIYFCPTDNCEEAVLEFLNSAEENIYCSLFEVSLPSIQNKLVEKSRRIDVKVVIDDTYIDRFNRPFVKKDKWGLMHNKFCVVDKNKLFTGSMNPTNNGVNKNNNNLLLINSKVLADNYLAEFNEMWDGQFKGGEVTKNQAVELSGILVKNYFCPEDGCAAKVKEELEKAEESIYFMTFSFTHQSIANILLLKKQEGLDIKGVMEARQVTKYSKFQQLEYQGIDVVKDVNKQNMHHKVFIIDDKCVVTGSFNPTNGGDTRNDENILVICDRGIVSKFKEEFDKIKS